MSANTIRAGEDVAIAAESFFGGVKKILGERRSTHPDPLEELSGIARLWTAYLGVTITPADAATMMVLLKAARGKMHRHADNEYDMAGYVFLRYLALGAEENNPTADHERPLCGDPRGATWR